jgi:hypothetical protein
MGRQPRSPGGLIECCEVDRLTSLFGNLGAESVLLWVVAVDPFNDETVDGLGRGLPLLEDDITESRRNHEEEGRLFAGALSCVVESLDGFDGGFVYVCLRRRSLLLYGNVQLGPGSATLSLLSRNS